MRMSRSLTLVALLLASSTIEAAAKETVVTVNWPGVQRSQLRLSPLRVTYFPKFRNAVCDSYHKGTYPGRTLRSGGTVRVSLVGAGGFEITSFKITRNHCG